MTSDWESVRFDRSEGELSELISIVSARVRMCAHGMTSWVDGEDVVNETWLRLVPYFEEKADREPEEWVGLAVRIARNYIIDQARVRKREISCSMDELVSLGALREDFAERSAETIDTFEGVGGLPRQFREIVTLVYIDEWPLADAAQVLGIGVRTAQRRLKKARERLVRVLKTGSCGRRPIVDGAHEQCGRGVE